MRGGFFQLAQSTAQFGICASLPCHQHPPYRCSCNSDDGYIFRSHTAIILHLSPALACGRRQWHLLSGSKLTHARFAYVTRAGNTVSQCPLSIYSRFTSFRVYRKPNRSDLRLGPHSEGPRRRAAEEKDFFSTCIEIYIQY